MRLPGCPKEIAETELVRAGVGLYERRSLRGERVEGVYVWRRAKGAGRGKGVNIPDARRAVQVYCGVVRGLQKKMGAPSSR